MMKTKMKQLLAGFGALALTAPTLVFGDLIVARYIDNPDTNTAVSSVNNVAE